MSELLYLQKHSLKGVLVGGVLVVCGEFAGGARAEAWFQ